MDIAFAIAMEFSRGYRKKYGRFLFNLKKVRESKWWVHFERASSFIERGNIKRFIPYFFNQDTLFEERLLPHVLVSKRGRELYKDFLALDRAGSSISSSDKIKSTLVEISKWCKENKIENNKIKSFVENRSNEMKIERGILYEPIFFFSKEYMNGRQIENIDIKRMLFKKNHEKIYTSLKNILGDDFLE